MKLGPTTKTVKPVHINTITSGDTILHNGVEQTVSMGNIRRGGLFGKTVFGDSYRAGSKRVSLVVFNRTGG